MAAARALGWGLGLLGLVGCGPTVLLSESGTEAGTSSAGESGPSGVTDSGVATSGVVETSAASGGPTPSTTGTSLDGDDADPDTSEADEGPVGSGFIDEGVAEDGAGPMGCSPWDQDCPDGEKCMPWSADNSGEWNSTRCVPIAASPDQPGDMCAVEGNAYSGIDTCDLGQMCWDVDADSNQGICTALCVGEEENPVCDDPETACVPVSEVHFMCLLQCDPLLQECDPSDTCVGVGGAFVCTPLDDEPGAVDSACDSYDDCALGLNCVADSTAGCDAEGCCASFCDLTLGNETCPGFALGEHCEPYFEEGTVIGQQDVGLCVL